MKKFLSFVLCLALITAQASAGINNPTGGGGTATPGGNNGDIQYNNAGALGGVTVIPLANGGTGSATAGGSLANLQGVTAWPIKRVPTSTDDAAHGYAVNQLYTYGNQTWISQAVTPAGGAVWQTVSNQPSYQLPCDAVSGAAGCYGVIKLRVSYTGNAFQIKRTSDSTTLNIGFDALNIADWKTVDIFCAATTCGVTTLYDQSGNGYDLTAATSTLPSVSLGNTVGKLRSISFSDAVNGYLVNSALPITNPQAMTTLFIGKYKTGQLSAAFYEVGYPTARYSHYDLSGTGINQFSGTATQTQPVVQLLVSNGATASNSFISQNDRKTVASAALSSTAATGLNFGDGLGNVSYPGSFESIAFIIYNSTLSATNQSLLLQSAYSASGIQPQTRDNLVLVGDSITAGTGPASPENTYQTMIGKVFDHTFNIYNLGHPGLTASAISSEEGPFATKLFQSGATNIVIIFAGTNDLAASTATTPASVIATIQTLAGTFRTAGYKVAVVTMLPRCGVFSGGVTSASFETNRLSFNSTMVSGYASYADALVDPGNDPVIGVAATYCTATYSADNVHPTALGYSYLTADMQRGLNALVQ